MRDPARDPARGPALAAAMAAAVAGLALLAPGEAAACSCLKPESWSLEQARAEGAVFAEVRALGERASPLGGFARQRLYTVAVRRGYGLKPGATIEVRTGADSAACGITIDGDDWHWLLLRPDAEQYTADLCSQLPLGGVGPEDWDRLAGPADE